MNKPPLGLTPRIIMDERRGREIIDAIIRYSKENLTIDENWIMELNDIWYRLHEIPKESITIAK